MQETRVILIGGPPGAGKTTLGRALAGNKGWLTLTGDDLVTAATAITNAETHPALHHARSVGHVEYFTAGPPQKLIADARELEELFWPGISAVIRKHVALDDPVVIDWWLLSPALVEMTPGVRSYWLHIDADVLLAREKENKAWVADSTDLERMLDNFMARSLWRNEYVREQASAVGLPVVEQDGTKTVADLIAEITPGLGSDG